VSVAEKGLLWLRMTAHGPAGHGSTPMPGRAPGKLLAAIARLQAREPEPVMDPSLRNALAQLGWQLGGVQGFVLKRPALHGMFVVPKLMANPAARAGLTNTVNVTGFSGGTEPNVVPSEASAVLDCRLLPGVEPLVFLAELRALVADPGITFEVLHSAKAAASPLDDPFYRALARHAVLDQPDAVAGPVLSVGYTDSILLRPLGVHAYGLVPFAVTQAEATTMHGEGERVSLANIARGLKVLLGAVLDVAADGAP
jgi:acetylornithine deacetylase/succinyl-diaminopimelate desuccinylase-like protein